MEKWKVVEGYPHYEVSNRGQVRSLSRLVKCGTRSKGRKFKGMILKPWLTTYKGKGWYRTVALCEDGARRSFYIHRLVLTAFRGPAPGMVCRHLDGDSLNNRLANLVWGTCKENMADKKRHGTMPYFVGEDNPSAKLTEGKVLKCRRLFATGNYTLTALAVWCGVKVTSMHHIIHRRTWKHI